MRLPWETQPFSPAAFWVVKQLEKAKSKTKRLHEPEILISVGVFSMVANFLQI
jgi:hypothetical protein